MTSNDLQITTQKTNHDLATRTLLKTTHTHDTYTYNF